MFRHRVDSLGTVLPKQYPIENIDYISDVIIKYPLIDSIPSGDTNLSVDSSTFIVDSSSIKFTSGYLSLGTIALDNYWTFESWCYLTANSSPIFSIGSTFGITYKKSNNRFEVKRKIISGETETLFLPANISLNTWVFISFIRDFDTLSVYINLEKISELTNYYFPIVSGTGYLGKVNTSTFTGNFTNFKLYNKANHASILYKAGNIEALKHRLYDRTPELENSDSKIIQIDSREIVHNFPLLPLTTFYSQLENCWSIPSSGLKINSHSLRVPMVYTLEFIFQISNTSQNSILFSNWKSEGLRYYYLKYLLETDSIQFVYFDVVSNSPITIDIGNYISNSDNVFTLQVFTDKFELFLNGIKTTTINEILPRPLTTKYSFNKSIEGNTQGQVILKLKQFVLTSAIKYQDNYIPSILTSNCLRPHKPFYQIKYHQIEQPIITPLTIDFSIDSLTSIDVNTDRVITLTQLEKYNFPVTYNYYLELLSEDDLTYTKLPASPSQVSISSNSLTNTFTIRVNITTTQSYNPKFKLVIYSKFSKKEYIFTVNETRTLTSSFISSIFGFVDGYLAKDSTISGELPNLLDTKIATTTATQYVDSLYGSSYYIDSSVNSIDIEAISNIRTVLLVYKEIYPVANRVYVGDDTSYTFNGGASGELVGDLIVSSSTYIPAFESTGTISNVKISSNNQIIVAIDDNLNKVLVYSKFTNGTWNSTPIEISTGISEANYLQGTSIYINDSGTAFALGFKNASNGEGVVQIWKYISNVWVKDLHISSPIPSPSLGAFGFQVAISNSATKLFVSELGSNKIYIFEKGSIWSNTPTHTLTGTDRFGFSLDINSDGTLLASTAVDIKKTYLYRFSSSWTLEQEISFGEICSLHKTENYVLVSQITTSQVKLYQKDSTWDIQETFSNVDSSFGYSISLDIDKNVYISIPQQSKVIKYLFDSTWIDTLEFSDSTTGYGYSFSCSTDSVVISNYSNLLKLLTKQSSALPQIIISSRQNKQNQSLSALLDTINPQILTFQSSIGLNISKIGAGLEANSIDGLFLGCLFFNRVLSIEEIISLENFIIKYLNLEIYSLI